MMGTFKRFILIFTISSCIVVLSQQELLAFEEHPPLSYYEVIEKRNIFRPMVDINKLTSIDASKDKSSHTAQSNSSSSIDDLTVTGIIKLRGQYKAIIEKKNEQKGFYVKVDDNIDDYTVKSIKNDTVTLQKSNSTYILKLNIAEPQPQKPSDILNSSTTQSVTSNETQQQDSRPFKTNVMQSLRTGVPNAQR